MKFRICILAALPAFLFACVSAPPLPAEKAADFLTNGFLDDSHFQMTATALPDSSAKGLVAQRESAAVKARNGLQESAVKALVEYRLAPAIKEDKELAARAAEARDMLKADFSKYIYYGTIAEEYYGRDNSASIVYRVIKLGLKAEIENASIKLPLKKGDAQ